MGLDFYVRVRTCKKRVTGKQPLGHLKDVLLSLTVTCPNFDNRTTKKTPCIINVLLSPLCVLCNLKCFVSRGYCMTMIGC